MQQLDAKQMKAVRGGFFWLLFIPAIVAAGAKAGATASGKGAGNSVKNSRC